MLPLTRRKPAAPPGTPCGCLDPLAFGHHRRRCGASDTVLPVFQSVTGDSSTCRVIAKDPPPLTARRDT